MNLGDECKYRAERQRVREEAIKLQADQCRATDEATALHNALTRKLGVHVFVPANGPEPVVMLNFERDRFWFYMNSSSLMARFNPVDDLETLSRSSGGRRKENEVATIVDDLPKLARWRTEIKAKVAARLDEVKSKSIERLKDEGAWD